MPLGELVIPALHSRDLVTWRPLGDALRLQDDAFEALWAPEVAYHEGAFYMYYSAGGKEGEGHRLRVATAAHPAGPYKDCGVVLTPDEPFSIDAHPFRDGRDGRWYLYYCRDFLDPWENGRVGTGIVVDRLEGMTRLAGEPRTVARPHADWQLYERQRRWYGRVRDWYTIEGASVRERDGIYYCFYSGGAWREPNYGVSYVVGDHPLGPFAPEESADGPEILRTQPGQIIGPGHASVTLGPDNVHEYLVYHAWNPGHTQRLMRVDRLRWDGGKPFSPGPTLEPQPAPTLPTFRDGFDGSDGAPPDPEAWQAEGGDWKQRGGELVQRDGGARPATALLAGTRPGPEFLCEANARLVEAGDERGRYGVFITDGAGHRTVLALAADGAGVLCGRERDPGQSPGVPAQGPGFESGVYHQLLLSVQGGRAEAWLDGVRVVSGLEVPPGAGVVGLFTWGASAAFDGVSLTALGRMTGG